MIISNIILSFFPFPGLVAGWPTQKSWKRNKVWYALTGTSQQYLSSIPKDRVTFLESQFQSPSLLLQSLKWLCFTHSENTSIFPFILIYNPQAFQFNHLLVKYFLSIQKYILLCNYYKLASMCVWCVSEPKFHKTTIIPTIHVCCYSYCVYKLLWYTYLLFYFFLSFLKRCLQASGSIS